MDLLPPLFDTATGRTVRYLNRAEPNQTKPLADWALVLHNDVLVSYFLGCQVECRLEARQPLTMFSPRRNDLPYSRQVNKFINLS